jgi:hypothetical protein
MLFPSLRLREDDLLAAWAGYVAAPNDATARAVLELLPSYRVAGNAPERRIAEHLEATLHVLESRVLEGHRPSAHLAVRLLTVADGAVAEYLDTILGQYIHVNPHDFLQLLTRYEHFRSPSMYCNFGIDLVDDFAGQQREARRRIQALESIQDPALQVLKARIIRDLSAEPRVGAAA